MNVVWFFADGFTEFNSSYFTCVVPHNALLHAGHGSQILHVHEFMANSPAAKRACAQADVIVLQRVLIDDSIPSAKYWMERGKKIVVSFDDAYQLIGPENAAYKFWGEGKVDVTVAGQSYVRTLPVHPVDQFRRNLRIISGGLTPSRTLANDWKQYASMYFIPNYVETHRYLGFPRPKKRYVGWGGSLSHLTSFSHSGVEQGLKSFLEKHPDADLALVGDKRVKEQIDIPIDRIWFREYVMFFEWPKILSSFSIGIAPLAMPYDQRRSRLKVMEYIAMGMPFVATKSSAYEDFWDCESGIFIPQGDPTICDKPNARAWEIALTKIWANYDDFVNKAAGERERYKPMYDNLMNAEQIAGELMR